MQNKLAIFLLGPPGAGKGTQAKLLAKKIDAVHLGSGDFCRAKIKQPGMEKFKKIYDNGKLLPSKSVMQWAKEEVKKIKNNNIVFEGWARTVGEMKEMSKIVKKQGFEIMAFNVWINSEESIKRNVLRARDSVDTEEKIKERLKVYEKRTKPVLKYLGKEVIQINGEQSIKQVHEDICNAFRRENPGANNAGACASCQARCPLAGTK